MKIFIKAKINSRYEAVERVDDNRFIVYVKEIPEKGRANKAIIKVMSEYFKIASGRISIISGHKSKNKIVEIS